MNSLHRSRVTGGALVAGLAIVMALTLTAPTAAGEWIVRVSQESEPGVGDFEYNILGFVKPFETAGSCGEFYGYDGSSYTGCYIRLDLQPDRSHLMFVQAADGMTAMTIQDSIDDPDGGIAEMMFELVQDEDGARWTVRDEPGALGPGGSVDLYSGGDGDYVFTSAQSWGRCCTDGMGLGDLDTTLRIQFTNVDGDPETPTIFGLTEWMVYGLDGHIIPLRIEEGVRAQFEILPTCSTDIDGDGMVGVDDLLVLLSTWGTCPFGE